MEWQRDVKTAPGQRAAASTRCRGEVAPLAGLESKGSSARLHTPALQPKPGGPGETRTCGHKRHPAHASFSCGTRAYTPVVERSARSQCPRACCSHDHADHVWLADGFCGFSRLTNYLTARIRWRFPEKRSAQCLPSACQRRVIRVPVSPRWRPNTSGVVMYSQVEKPMVASNCLSRSVERLP